MSFEGKDYYEILGVARDANEDEIRRAYREKARKLHPDVNKSPDAAQQFSKMQEAYDILSDPEKRSAYDNFLRYGVRTGGPSAAGGRSQTWQGVDIGGIDPGDFASIFEQIMGGARQGRSGGAAGGPAVEFDFDFGPGGPRRAQERARRPAKGGDLRHAIDVSFMEAALGAKQGLRLTVDGRSEVIEFSVPPGIGDGAKMRVKGKGQPGRAGAPPGDLILTVSVGAHPYFRREGLDVLIDVPITVTEATLGTKVAVPLLKGTVDLTIPPGTSSGRRLRVRGKGIDTGRRKGDFYAVMQIVAPMPAELEKEDLALLERLGSRLKNPRLGAPWSDMR